MWVFKKKNPHTSVLGLAVGSESGRGTWLNFWSKKKTWIPRSWRFHKIRSTPKALLALDAPVEYLQSRWAASRPLRCPARTRTLLLWERGSHFPLPANLRGREVPAGGGAQSPPSGEAGRLASWAGAERPGALRTSIPRAVPALSRWPAASAQPCLGRPRVLSAMGGA